MKRRTFLNDLSRYAILGGMISMSGFLWRNRGVYPTENCTYTPVCRHCREFKTCEKILEKKPVNSGK